MLLCLLMLVGIDFMILYYFNEIKSIIIDNKLELGMDRRICNVDSGNNNNEVSDQSSGCFFSRFHDKYVLCGFVDNFDGYFMCLLVMNAITTRVVCIILNVYCLCVSLFEVACIVLYCIFPLLMCFVMINLIW